MKLTTIYLILSIIFNITLFLLYRQEKKSEQLQEQIIQKQKRLIELLKEMDELKKKTRPN